MKLLQIINNRRVLTVLLLLGVFGVWLASWAFWYEPSSLTVKNYTVKIPELNPAFNNFKIVAISDVHGGSNFITEEKIRTVVELANEQNPDVIVLLGDYVSQKAFNRRQLKMPMETIAENLRGLKARNGVFAVIGNHDWWFDEKKVVAELERVGVRVLNIEAARIEKDGNSLILLGLPELLKYNIQRKYIEDSKTALSKINPANENIIALVHNPDAFAWITGETLISENLRLVLAGHTHGGQCNFPLIGAPVVPSTYGQKYAQGLIQENGRQMFVTPGIGTSIMPVRFRVPPEISVLTLTK